MLVLFFLFPQQLLMVILVEFFKIGVGRGSLFSIQW